MNHSLNAPAIAENRIPEFVWYDGTDALVKGEGMCYDITRGVSTSKDGSRGNYVVKPDGNTNQQFAGVVARNYSAQSTGQLVEIYNPGSICEVAIGIDCTLGGDVITCMANGVPRFAGNGKLGRGSAVPLQTSDEIVLRSIDGSDTLSSDGKTLLCDTTNIEAGDKVVFLGGVTPGRYTVNKVISGSTLELTEQADTSGDVKQVAFYVYRNNPTVTARLLTGEESGLIEYITPPSAGGAVEIMAGGVSVVLGGITLAANVTTTIADGNAVGMDKTLVCSGDLTSNSFVATLATAGIQMDGSTALTTITVNGAGQIASLTWYGVWQLQCNAGATLA